MSLFGKNRPDAKSVATRATVLKYVVVYALTAPPRHLLQRMASQWSAEEREQFRRDGEARRDEYWSNLGPLATQLSPAEKDYAQSTILTMTAAQQINSSWRVEAFQVLLWALGLLPELPPFDEPADHDLLRGFPPEDDYIRRAELLESVAIHEAREAAELWHWRSRTRQLQEDGDPFPTSLESEAGSVASYDDVVRATARSAFEDGTLSLIKDEDFAVFGKAYRDASPDEWAAVRSITAERHFALNWLCGYAPKLQWDETPTDT